ncbi:MAG: LysR family transcriptional regulator [Pseudobdellovibrio sp.]
MDLNHLRCFYEVALSGSFSLAAKRLHVTQSSLSKSVALLEHRQGIKLLMRSKKGVSLTPLGEGVFARCIEIFKSVEEISQQCKGYTENCEGYLRFGISDHLAQFYLVDNLKKFCDLYPKVTPSFYIGSPHEVIPQVLSGALEFGLCFTKIPDAELEYKRLHPFELVVVDSNKAFEKESPESLKIISSISRDFPLHPSKRLLESSPSNVKINIEVNSQVMQKKLCLAGAGSVLLTKFLVRDEIARGELKILPMTKPMFTDLLLVKRKKQILSKPAQKFIEEVVSQFKD